LVEKNATPGTRGPWTYSILREKKKENLGEKRNSFRGREVVQGSLIKKRKR